MSLSPSEPPTTPFSDSSETMPVSYGRFLIQWGAVHGFLAVALGAFGAHGLRGKISPDLLEVYQTGAHYHLVHAVMLVVVGVLAGIWRHPEGTVTRAAQLAWYSGLLFGVGIVIFSGTLYLLALTGMRWLGAITPIGGVCFLSGWALLTVAASRLSSAASPNR